MGNFVLSVLYLYSIFASLHHLCLAGESNSNKDLVSLESCSGVEDFSRENSAVKFRFSEIIRQTSRGFSVEFIFSEPINDMKAKDNSSKPAIITEMSKTHWIISVPKIQISEVRKAEFTANYKDSNNSKIAAIILNGENVVCGAGKGRVFTEKSVKYDGMKECNVTKVSYEHETTITIEENFYSDRIGLVVDIFTESDVDTFHEVSNMLAKMYGKRHFCLVNSGYLTSRDKPVKVSFALHHSNRKAPKISAVVMNDVVICGFATTLNVFEFNTLMDINISSTGNIQDDLIHSVDVLSLSLNVITACSLLVTIVTGIFAWKLTKTAKPAKEEPLYALPNKTT